MNGDAILRLERLTKTFAQPVLRDVSIEVSTGERLTIIGPSGAGKTTLLRLIAGLEEPTSGSIFINNNDATKRAPEKRDIAMVFQTPALYPHLSAFENIAFPLRLRKAADTQARVEEIASALGLTPLLKRAPTELSGGEAQRVALARALVRKPALLLMDEPLSSLPPDLRLQVRHELARIFRAQKSTVIYVTHDHEDALALGDRVVVLNDGAIQQIGTPREVYERPANRFVAKFLGRPPMNFLGANGIRPEAFQLCDEENAKHTGFVLSAQYLGPCTDLLVQVGDAQINVRIYGAREFKIGEKISLAVKPSDIHRFE